MLALESLQKPGLHPSSWNTAVPGQESRLLPALLQHVLTGHGFLFEGLQARQLFCADWVLCANLAEPPPPEGRVWSQVLPWLC